MKVYLAATALLLEPINAQQLLTSNQRRLRNRELSDKLSDNNSTSTAAAATVSNSNLLRKLSKAGKSKAGGLATAAANVTTPLPDPKEHSLTGVYAGVDTEDATQSQLYIVCDNDEDKGVLCDIMLRDPRFSACDKLNPGTTKHGVGIATEVPQDSIDDFLFDLYCLDPGEREIDYTKGPTTTLLGNIEILPDGSLRRTGPGLFYAKISLPGIKDETSDEVANIDDESFNPNGKYRGVDLVDGSVQVS